MREINRPALPCNLTVRSSGAPQCRKAARVRVSSCSKDIQTRLHGGDFCLLAGNNFLGETANERILAMNQDEAGHFNRAGMMWNHGRKEIDIRVASW